MDYIMDCLIFLWKSISFVIIGALFSDSSSTSSSEHFNAGIFWLIIILLGVVILVKIMSKIKQEKEKSIQNVNSQFIKSLAEDFINETISNNKVELNEKDYEKFNNIFQIENNIKIPNSYNTNVPYCIREVLYSVYLKKIKDINK